MTARFITAPDKLPAPDAEEEHKKILIVDSEWHDIENIAFLCMTRQVKYDFYLFGPTSIDTDWLDHAAEEADTILINNTSQRHSGIKSELLKLNKSIEIGEGNTLKTPMDFIVKQIEEE
jgi:hypothetical protein